ncbi:hypothetical protein [Brumimicrobium aurantiacum]|uniref:Lipocalin-like domain-containing protein n=1 Tax=Brumimicrobium aurantiacum TaxID=1737063 RepID=A0A3E1EYJ3_9FLAO|nr:hypothetical protein [Brumimicrobium aurantiacum]RFC54616.1 hypothetical protein DXU93_06410 [Brumimicrobium aurantiacum]
MKKVLLFLLVVVVAISCKKENRIERNLWKKDGEWNIKSWTETSTSSQYPEDNYSETYVNFGTFKFNKDGSGSMTYNDGNSAYAEQITYENTENSLTIFDSDGDGTIFDMTWEKNEMTLSLKESETYTSYDPNTGEQVVVNYTYDVSIDCEKK